MTRLYTVRAFGSSWVCFSLMSALVLISSFRLEYGPSIVVTLSSIQGGQS